jgi:hypothetical protein
MESIVDTHVKLRPDTHYAPVEKGVYWSRPGGRSFVLTGPPALYGLIDANHHLLVRGTSVDELVDAIGNDRARPVLDHVVRTLLAEDMLLDVDAGGPRPSEPDATAYADVLAYLEAQCDRPYDAFAAIRTARIRVLGTGPAVGALLRGLNGYGIGAIVRDEHGDADLTVVVDDADDPRTDPDGRTLLVATGHELATVGVVTDGPEQQRAMRRAVERFGTWARRDAVGAAPRPLSAVYAGALAARTVIDALSGLEAAAQAAVVYGSALECRRLPLRLADGEDAVGEPSDAVVIEAEPDEMVGVTVDEAATSRIHERASVLTARWTGAAAWSDDLDLPQLPVAVATVVPLETPETAFLGWGGNRAEAGVDALLAMLRAHAGGASAAGSSPDRFLLDGLLRAIGDEVAVGAPTPVDPTEIGAWILRSLYGIVTEYFDQPLRLELRQWQAGPGWHLATATDDRGRVLAHEWGPTRQAALYAVLNTVTVGCQLADAKSDLRPPAGIGTWAVRPATDAQVTSALREITNRLGEDGRTITTTLAPADPVTGERPLPYGWVTIR